MNPNQNADNLTKREYAAIQIAAGFSADSGTRIEAIPEMAVSLADALLAELENNTPENGQEERAL